MAPEDDYGPSTYGDRWAGIYDRFARLPTDTDATVEFLAGLAGPGPALELGIGTGRVALPLAERRYAWPSELDLMARLAEMRLRERWGGWQREPFTSTSPNHISIYERAPH